MKQELSILLQFFSIVLLAGFGLFGIAVLLDSTMLSFWNAYKWPFINWIAAFLAIAPIRLVLIYLTANPAIVTSNSNSNKSFLGKEICITVQYLVIALVSIMFSFYIPVLLKTDENINLNLNEMWLGLKDTFLYWFIGFAILSFIRLGIRAGNERKLRNENVP